MMKIVLAVAALAVLALAQENPCCVYVLHPSLSLFLFSP